MATTPKLLFTGYCPNAEAAATAVTGQPNVPVSTRWDCKLIVYNSGAAARTVTLGWHSSNAALVVADYLINAESLGSKEVREFGIRFIPAGYYLRAGQGTADADVQIQVWGEEVDV